VNKKIVGLGLAAVAVVIIASGGGDYSDYKDKSLSEFKSQPIATKHSIVEDYLSDADLESSAFDGVYACLSQMSYTKSGNLKLSEVAGWCKTDHEDGNTSQYTNFDNFEKGFSPWDGAYRSLESRIKKSMHDGDSYEHVSTRFRLILNGMPYAMITTQFKGKNAFGAVVQNSVTAKVDLASGDILEVN